ncbi:hypothetical protein VNI00_012158 [Paramarasmius palmivorus]|uniref:F-box protein n=1 Tax=Paramarasmius palmivorus TaxID=297713 RepID=A0AAW0C786_9AGAR
MVESCEVDIFQLGKDMLPILDTYMENSGDSGISVTIVVGQYPSAALFEDEESSEETPEEWPEDVYRDGLGKFGLSAFRTLSAVKAFSSQILPLPLLQSLELTDSLSTLTVSEVDNLTKLVHDILRHCTRLERLEIADTRVHYNLGFYSESTLEVELSTMRHLSLAYNRSVNYDRLFKIVRLPALEALSLQQVGRPSFQWPTAQFLDMIRRSKAALKYIDIDLADASLSDAEYSGCISELFRLCPDLCKLHVNLKNGDALFMSLEELAGCGFCFPKLQDVVIRTADTTDETEDGKAKHYGGVDNKFCCTWTLSTAIVPVI